jgi:Sec-independent protein translocase protein TatA
MFGSFGMLEILLILVVGVFVFGVIKLPRFARSIGTGFQELKRLKRGLDMGFDEDEDRPREEDRRSSRQSQGYRQTPDYDYQGPQDSWQQGPAQGSQDYGQTGPAQGPSPQQPQPGWQNWQQPPPQSRDRNSPPPEEEDKKQT